MTSEHYNQDRDWREYLISTVIGEGNIVDSFVVDKCTPEWAGNTFCNRYRDYYHI